MATMSSQGSRIDRHSPIPMYFQLARLLSAAIVGGELSAGTRLPSEPNLCTQFNVSRATVRQAFQRLENEGLIRRVKGHGTFVADARERSWLLQSSEGFFHEEVDRLGFDVTSKVLQAEHTALSYPATQALQLPVGSVGGILERIRYVDNKVALHVTDFVPAQYADAVLSLQEQDGSLYDRLEELSGVTVHGGRRTLEAAHAPAAIAELLEVKPRTALSFIESVSWDREGHPFHFFQLWLRTDRIKIEVEVIRTQKLPEPATAEGMPQNGEQISASGVLDTAPKRKSRKAKSTAV
jgi:GntR family transcriptional regulator